MTHRSHAPHDIGKTVTRSVTYTPVTHSVTYSTFFSASITTGSTRPRTSSRLPS